MTTPAPFVEFTQLTEAMAQVAGELRGLVNSAEALPRKLAALDALVTRALAQTEVITRHAATLAADAQRDVAARTADRDARRAELDGLREAARATLR